MADISAGGLVELMSATEVLGMAESLRELIETRQRGGTRVLGNAHRGRREEAPAAWSDVDFLFCSPDPALLPSTGRSRRPGG
ncbi:hypothetical protein [Citricoccus sp. NR2]|uniref:hypothetical protein n=1 Tax=Citricoccus sp. NR2 TaxID=3004095 RepID=UPI0022DDBF0B|nr:hypothetical protein [Citricoccus sp. NR2]WBL20217.1 hypothetical protein O1A05_05920 [Citricoccus sp. NR2]